MPAKKQITKKLNTALKLLKEQGYGAVNSEQPAKEMGCFTQPVYLSFSRMEELRQKLIPLTVTEFESYMKSGSENGAVCLYGGIPPVLFPFYAAQRLFRDQADPELSNPAMR